MDYDNDGIKDIISGSYDPGDVYLIRGLGNGEYAAVESITDQDGTSLVHHPTEFKRHLETVAASKNTENKNTENAAESSKEIMDQIASFGSWVTPMDWDDDGDLDMLIGTFNGELYLRKNVGSREQPEYDGSSEKVLADGKPLREDSHTSPVAADWDGDGLTDLVVGSGNGSVSWYKNLGSSKFGPRNVLVSAPADSIHLTQYLYPDEQAAPGPRAQICVHDFNHDGRLDLLVGDCSTKVTLDKSWSPEQKVAMNQALHVSAAIMKRVAAVEKRFKKKYMEAMDDGTLDMEALHQEMEAEMDKANKVADSMPFSKETDELFVKLPTESKTISHVWLYLRKSN